MPLSSILRAVMGSGVKNAALQPARFVDRGRHVNAKSWQNVLLGVILVSALVISCGGSSTDPPGPRALIPDRSTTTPPELTCITHSTPLIPFHLVNPVGFGTSPSGPTGHASRSAALNKSFPALHPSCGRPGRPFASLGRGGGSAALRQRVRAVAGKWIELREHRIELRRGELTSCPHDCIRRRGWQLVIHRKDSLGNRPSMNLAIADELQHT